MEHKATAPSYKQTQCICSEQGTHSNCIFKFPVYSLSDHKFSVPMYVFCDYYIHKSDLADLSSLKKNWTFSQQILIYLLPLESGNLHLEQTKFPVFLESFQILCVSPDRDFFLPFSLFTVCSGYPGKRERSYPSGHPTESAPTVQQNACT